MERFKKGEKHYHYWIIDHARGRVAYRGPGYHSRSACNTEAGRREHDPDMRFVRSCTKACTVVKRRNPAD